MPWVERFIGEAAAGEADIVCFPECYIPGLRGQEFSVEAHDPARLAAARERVLDKDRTLTITPPRRVGTARMRSQDDPCPLDASASSKWRTAVSNLSRQPGLQNPTT